MNVSGYAQRDGTLMHVSEVARGLACGCSCVKCNERMVAKKGRKRRQHFAHYVQSECSGSAETALHILGKEIIRELRDIEIPAYVFGLPNRIAKTKAHSKGHLIVKGGTAMIDHAESEVAIGGIVADSIITCGGKSLIIELAVTHPIDKLKVRKLRRIGLPAIQIHLRREDSLMTRKEISNKIQKSVSAKEWVFHPKQKSIELGLLRQLRANRKKERAGRRTQRGSTESITFRRRQLTKQGPASPNGWTSEKIRKWDKFVYTYREKHGESPGGEEIRRWEEANKVRVRKRVP